MNEEDIKLVLQAMLLGVRFTRRDLTPDYWCAVSPGGSLGPARLTMGRAAELWLFENHHRTKAEHRAYEIQTSDVQPRARVEQAWMNEYLERA